VTLDCCSSQRSQQKPKSQKPTEAKGQKPTEAKSQKTKKPKAKKPKAKKPEAQSQKNKKNTKKKIPPPAKNGSGNLRVFACHTCDKFFYIFVLGERFFAPMIAF